MRLDIEFTELVTGYRLRYNASGHFVDAYLYDSLSSGAGYAVSVADNIDELLSDIEKLLKSCDCDSACNKCLKHYRNQHMHGILDRFSANELLKWGTTGKLPNALSIDKQLKIIKPLEEILNEYGCKLMISGEHISVTNGEKERMLAVYPGMWSEPEDINTIHVSDLYIKYAKPYAVQKIIDELG